MKLSCTDHNIYIESESSTENNALRISGFTFDKSKQLWATPFWQNLAIVWSYLSEGEKEIVKAFKSKSDDRMRNGKRIESSSEYPCPEEKSFFHFQKAGIDFLLQNKNALLADPMGLGKTIQAIGLINEIKAKKVLVICPASLKINWRRELEAWLTINRSIAIWSSKKAESADIVIINYDIVHKCYTSLRIEPWDTLILDEAHYLKNPKAKRTLHVLGGRQKAAKNTVGKVLKPIPAKRNVALTGTPILNRPSDLFSILKFLCPYGFPNKHKYMQRYCDLKIVNGYWDSKGASNLTELNSKLRSTIMIRRKKEDVLKDLPEKLRQIIEIEPSISTGRRLMDELGFLSKIEFDKAVKTLKLPKHLAFSEPVASLRRKVGEDKIEKIADHIKLCLETNRKIIVFAYHKSVISELSKVFNDICVVVTGDVSLIERQDAVDAFQTDPEIKLFIGNIDAAGVGITLTASSHIIFAETVWEPGKISQAEDRAHRIGQRNSVLIQHLVWKNSLDSYMIKAVIKKQENIDNALGD